MTSLLFPLLVNAAAYQVQEGDLIKVSLPGENSLDEPFGVDREGTIILPEVGTVMVVGLSKSDVETPVRKQLAKAFRDLSNLQVYIFKRQLLSVTVAVMILTK